MTFVSSNLFMILTHIIHWL